MEAFAASLSRELSQAEEIPVEVATSTSASDRGSTDTASPVESYHRRSICSVWST